MSNGSLKNCLVLTGHTRGLGLALAQRFLGMGWKVMGLSRKQIDHHPALTQVDIDLSDSGTLSAWLAGNPMTHWLQGAETAMLINNAGQVGPIATAGAANAADLAAAVALNVSAPLMLTDAFLKTGVCADRRIVHISSGAARSAYAGWSTYCATKAALDHHARCLQTEISAGLHRGVLVASVAPGVIDTDMQADVRQSDESAFPARQRFVDLKTSGALASPQSVAEKLQRYVCSDAFGEDATPDLRSLSI